MNETDKKINKNQTKKKEKITFGNFSKKKKPNSI